MKPAVKREIQEIIREIDGIARELEELSHGINQEFKGIGATVCSKNMQALSSKYRYVSNDLRRTL
ncbi:hypothetical protein [Aquibacillus kalidii]|uniref:hypothetical protein n=1 Tax=Aquibacillus kalidii TaxID=2762597 RepID=UPI0016464011|nr:hypothetical protein [Aquibacillus kalidii]